LSSAHPFVADPRRWKALAVLGAIQFMLVLDITVVNVALPRIQHDLGFSHPGLAWVVNGYVLMAGGLLLLGGRLADIVGRRRMFLLGVGLFAAASATCGAAVDPAMLVISRFVQGAGEAFAAPASLGLIAVLFPDPRERMKALGMWGGIAGLGGTTGTVISGALVDLASWRWIFYVNIPIGIAALLMTLRRVDESRNPDANRPDWAGFLTFSAGLAGLVYGLITSQRDGWGATSVIASFAASAALLCAFFAIERRRADPMLDLGLLRVPSFGGGLVAAFAISVSILSVITYLIVYLQNSLGLSAMGTGFASCR
jgi:EmrB/QacA subfamily drug resistance transporter